MTLPLGFRVRLRPEVRRLEGGALLVGGSPVRAVRLGARMVSLLTDLVVRDARSEQLVRRLVDANLADPDLGGVVVDPSSLTVVIPVRDRPESLDRALMSLADPVRPAHVIVVDDASRDPDAIAAVADRNGAGVLRLETNAGPAGARNHGLQHVRTPYVAFVDSDVHVDTPSLLALARHFADPRVALVGPLIRARSLSRRPRWFERFDEVDSSLTQGAIPGFVRPGAAVGWLPSACLVGRTAALGSGFEEAMRVGEDVDLVWRLVDSGLLVRYDPAFVAEHDTRRTLRGWLGRKVIYGQGSAILAKRHSDHVAPAVLSPTLAISAAVLLLGRRWSPVVAAPLVVRALCRIGNVLPATPEGWLTSVRLTASGVGGALYQESQLLLRHWWPVTALGASRSHAARRMLLGAFVVDTIVALGDRSLDAGLLIGLAGRRLDDLAYGTGLWLGAVRQRSGACLRIRFAGQSRARGWFRPSRVKSPASVLG